MNPALSALLRVVLFLCLVLGAGTGHPAAFRGESCQACHASIRDAQRPLKTLPAKFRGNYDVIVIGGGLSGLTAAHYLKDLKVLVLEKEDRPGGKTRRERFGRWSYSVGAVYCAKPYGIISALYKELHIYPAKFKAPIHVYWTGGRRIKEWITEEGISELASTPEEAESLRRFVAKLKEVDSEGKLTIPIQDSDPKLLEAYDSMSFQDYLLQNFGKRAAELGDHYARDVFGAGAAEVSAAAGLLYMGSEVSDSYAWPGGLGEVAESITRELGSRVETGALVEGVIPSSDSVRIVFQQGGKLFEARARATVMAVPSMVARRIVSGLSQKKERALASLRYSSYALVPMRFKKPVYQDSFVLWTEGLSISDFTFPGGERLEGPSSQAGGQVAAAYMPMGSSEGRRRLLAASDEEIEKDVLADLDKVLPGASRELSEMRVVRWGHAMPILAPGFLSKIQPILREPEGRLFFAGVDTQAPAVEGAMVSGYQAAGQIREYFGKEASLR